MSIVSLLKERDIKTHTARPIKGRKLAIEPLTVRTVCVNLKLSQAKRDN